MLIRYQGLCFHKDNSNTYDRCLNLCTKESTTCHSRESGGPTYRNLANIAAALRDPDTSDRRLRGDDLSSRRDDVNNRGDDGTNND